MRFFSILGVLLMILSGCGSGRKDDRTAIAVSFEPQAWMLRQIAGDDLDIVTLLPPGSDPETYQPSISTMKGLGKAKVFFTLATNGFEKSITSNFPSNFPDLKIVDCTQGVEKIMGSHGHHDRDGHNHEEEFDPHLFSSIPNSITIAENMTQTLIEINPEKAEQYCIAGESLKLRLQALNDSIKKMGLNGKTLALRHPSLSYFARDYGLTQIPLQSDGKEASPLQLRQRMEEIRDSGTKVFIIEKEHANPSDKEIAQQLGLKTVEVSLTSPSWLEDLMKIADEINRN